MHLPRHLLTCWVRAHLLGNYRLGVLLFIRAGIQHRRPVYPPCEATSFHHVEAFAQTGPDKDLALLGCLIVGYQILNEPLLFRP